MEQKASGGANHRTAPPSSFPCNIRDLGGTPLTDGGSVRPGLLFRSDDPGRGDLASGDRLTRQLGVRHVIDLRHREEIDRAGTLGSFVTRADVVHHPVPITLYDALRDDPMPTDAVEMGRLYARSLTASAPSYVSALRAIATADDPALVHCSHGKDRTGIVIALTLLAVGARKDTIVADFARTGENLAEMRRTARELGVSIGLSRVQGILLEAPAEAMEIFLDSTEREHGSALNVLRAAGLEPSTIDALRHRLTR